MLFRWVLTRKWNKKRAGELLCVFIREMFDPPLQVHFARSHRLFLSSHRFRTLTKSFYTTPRFPSGDHRTSLTLFPPFPIEIELFKQLWHVSDAGSFGVWVKSKLFETRGILFYKISWHWFNFKIKADESWKQITSSAASYLKGLTLIQWHTLSLLPVTPGDGQMTAARTENQGRN